ncbi:MAG: DNA-directed RNA polymerase [Candidatus Altiarchaeota archaeon]|nr:DNA-directed RNA polymerase [Candidatus Altiarchaeota archaeon]
MFETAVFKQSVRVMPKLLKGNTKQAVADALKETEGQISKTSGMLLLVTGVKDVGEGRIIPGDGAVYFDAVYEALVFSPKLHEVVDGEITDIVEFGAFVRIGPMDGLIHISQVMDDYVSYSKEGVLQGKQSKNSLKVGDKVRARIISISYKAEPAKLGLTMRQPGLGKWEWLHEEKQE